MKKLITLLLLLQNIACTNTSQEYIKINPEAQTIQTELIISDKAAPRMYYDIAVIDSCMAVSNFHSDSLLQIRPLNNPEQYLRCFYQGNGPYEYSMPFALGTVRSEYDRLSFFDIQSRKLVTLKIDSGINMKEKIMPDSLPACHDLNETSQLYYGVDVDMVHRLFFICDKTNGRVQKSIEYFPDIQDGYDEFSLPMLYMCSLCVNENSHSVITAMLNMNLIHFYDLEGNRKKSILIGDQLQLPEKGSKSLDFHESNKYFRQICGNEQYVYALYSGKRLEEGASDIFVFDWDGEIKKRYHTDRPLEKLAVTKSDKYLVGIALNEEGGTDIVKIPLE